MCTRERPSLSPHSRHAVRSCKKQVIAMSPPNEEDRAIDEEVLRFGEIARVAKVEQLKLEAPPVELWARIESAALKLEAEKSQPSEPLAPVHDLAARRHLATRLIAVAAALTLVVAGFAAVLRFMQDEQKVIREVALSNRGLSASGARSAGVAQLVETKDGGFAIKLNLSDLPQTDANYFELWAIDTQVKGMVSLGPLHDSGIYEIPAGVDPDRFPIIDISIEPTDGVPTHSGESVLRGRLA